MLYLLSEISCRMHAKTTCTINTASQSRPGDHAGARGLPPDTKIPPNLDEDVETSIWIKVKTHSMRCIIRRHLLDGPYLSRSRV